MLSELSDAARQRLRLRPVQLPGKTSLQSVGAPMEQLWFLDSGLASTTTLFQDGSQIEVATHGCCSIIGVEALLGTRVSSVETFMQLEGKAWVSPTSAALEEFHRGEDFQRIVLRFVQLRLDQATQTAACNGMHDLDQRLARWLLQCCDLAGEQRVQISHEFLSQRLGVARPSMTLALRRLEHANGVATSRGEIVVLRRDVLETRCCECYAALNKRRAKLYS